MKGKKAKKKIVKKTIKKAAAKKVHRALITKDMIIADVIQKYPHAKQVFAELGLMCALCGFSGQETIEQAAGVHGINLKKLLNGLNRRS